MSILVNFRIEEKLKKDKEKMCNKLGITMSAAFNMFAKNLVNTGSINFSLKNSYKSGIDYKYFFEKLSGDSQSIVEESEIETLENEFTKKDRYYLNKIGNIIMLVPKDDPWAGVRDSNGTMSDEFMTTRDQLEFEKREEL